MVRLTAVFVLAGALAAGCTTTKKAPLKAAATVPTTTTTVMPVPTTLPVTTTTVVPVTVPPTTEAPAPVEPTVEEPTPVPTGDVTQLEGDDSDIETWLAIGRCEQPGDGWGGVNWAHRGPRYQGGLGMYYGTWQSYGGLELFGIANAGDATPMQQIVVARRVRDAHGYGAWGCAGRLGLA